MRRCYLFFLVLILQHASAQHPYHHFSEAVDIRYDVSQPVVNYTLRVDLADLSLLQVEMHVRNIADTFRVAMFAHPEYDDRYYRYIENLQIKKGTGTIEKIENALWKVHVSEKEVTILYKIRLPNAERQRGAWRPFLSPAGGLIGGPHSYLYIVGATLAPSYVHLDIPKDWMIATGLQSTSDPHIFFAPTVDALVDGPIMIGQLKQWSFVVDGVPHRVVYWPLSNAAAIDSTELISNIQKLVVQSAKLFGRLPYREYSFLLQDSSYGALEHANSVTLGVPSARLSENMQDYLEEIAHEYFHTWNIMRIRPAEYGDVDYHKPPLSKGLWWSEGLTMFYADLLLRRAGLAQGSRTEHLKNLVYRYYSNPGNHKISAEKLSMSSYAPPGFLGDYDGSAHLQGELFGNLLDILIRNATNGKKSMDDVMRKMVERFSVKGFEGRDIEKLITEVSGVNVHSFFEDHIRNNKIPDLNRYLQPLGLQYSIAWKNAEDDKHQLIGDTRVYAFQSPDEHSTLLGILDPSGSWGKAGLHTGDVLLAVNKTTIKSTRDFYMIVRNAKMGDSLFVLVKRNDRQLEMQVIASAYQQPVVRIDELKTPTSKQQQLLMQWKAGL